MKTLRSLLLLSLCFPTSLYSSCATYAGWFGPSNYKECILDKMKGQTTFMLPLVEEQCTVQFACNAEARRKFEDCISLLGGPGIYSVPICQSDVREACKPAAPSPSSSNTTEILLDKDNTEIKWKFCGTKAETVSICVTDNEKHSIITRVVGHFAYKAPCTLDEPFTKVIGQKAWFEDRYDFRMNGEFNCYYVEFFGPANN